MPVGDAQTYLVLVIRNLNNLDSHDSFLLYEIL